MASKRGSNDKVFVSSVESVVVVDVVPVSGETENALLLEEIVNSLHSI
jgi:hypothetical protein